MDNSDGSGFSGAVDGHPAVSANPGGRAAWYVGPGGSDGNDCLSPGLAHPCATINGALNKPGFVAGDTIRVAVGLYIGTGNDEPKVWADLYTTANEVI